MIPNGHKKRFLFENLNFGWVAIVSDEQYTRLQDAIGWPDSYFCQMFHFTVIPLQGANNLEQGRLWEVYKEQTPESWSS